LSEEQTGWSSGSYGVWRDHEDAHHLRRPVPSASRATSARVALRASAGLTGSRGLLSRRPVPDVYPPCTSRRDLRCGHVRVERRRTSDPRIA
jgi:hypothetical protein